LEEKRFERVGGTVSVQVDVRLVAATNKGLRAAVAARRFREDLFFRLSVFPITVPPLRDRPTDIPILARYFVDRICRDVKKKTLTLSPESLEHLRAYRWPGNVRELQNCIERAVILADGDTILPRHLNLSFAAPLQPDDAPGPWEQIDLSGSLSEATRRTVAEVERRKIEQVMQETERNKGRAAELLQISYKMLLSKLKEHRIE
jgi:transcriptional regulator with GAF, ATPase, and Fis domain